VKGLVSSSGRQRWRELLALAVLCVVACAQVGGQKPPVVAPNGTLSVGAGDAAAAADTAFRVVFAGPEGEVAQGAEISIVFSRPLRALELAGAETPPPVVLAPSVRGRWQWVGTSALIFVPETGRLPAATHFSVEVPAEVRALDGSTLGKPYRFEFETARPALARSRPSAGEQGRTRDTKLELYFNQPIDPKQVERLGKLSATRGGYKGQLGFEAVRPDSASPRRMELRPRQPLPANSAIALEIAPGLRGDEGPLVTLSPITLEFHTYGPLRVVDVFCSRKDPRERCAPRSALNIELSNPVKTRELKRLVSVTPALPLRWDSWLSDDEETTYASVAAAFKPGQSYTLRIGGQLRDRYGQTLGNFARKMDFDDLPPTVEIGVQGDNFEPGAVRPVPVASVNVDRFELVTASLGRDQVLTQQSFKRDNERFDALRRLTGAKSTSVTPGAALNVISERAILPTDVLGPKARGALAIGVRYRGRQGERNVVRLLRVTDLAISAKVSRYGSLVWVSRLSDGRPVANAEVEVAAPNAPPRRYTSDAQGLVAIRAADFAPSFRSENDAARALVFARSGDDWTYRTLSERVDEWRLGVPVDLDSEQQLYGLIFTERGIYRPGDDVHVKGIARVESPRGNDVPAGRALDIELRDSEGKKWWRRSVTTTRFGSFALDFKLPPGAALGHWELTVGHPVTSIYGGFEVLEYRPAEFKVSVESSRPSYVHGDRADWTARAEYLFGAPMSGAGVHYFVSRSPTTYMPPNSEDLTTDAAAYWNDFEERSLRAGALNSSQGKLDAKGELKTQLTLELPGQREPELVSVDAEVTDISRQSLAGSTSAIVHPAEFYLGMKLGSDYFAPAPGKLATEVVALAPDGRRLAGKPVLVELLRRRWTLARQESGGSELHSVSKPVDTVVGSCALTTAAAPQRCSIAITEGGYYVFHATAKDGRGNVAHAATSLFAIGEGRTAFGDNDKQALELVLDRKRYRAGDRAKILVKSPFSSAEALVTVERAGVYRTERVVLRGATPVVTVPITEDLLPNAYVGVHLIRPRTGPFVARGRPDAGAPTFRVGYVELPIDPESRRLKVELKPSQRELRPGATLTVDVQVTDSKAIGQAAEVTLYAVDEGVLSLVDYKTPDPLAVFTRPRPLQVATLESRSSLAKVGLEELSLLLGPDKGAEGGGGGEGGVRRDFRQSAYFNPSVLTDKDGRGRVSFKLPDSLTTYRLMAIATIAGDRYGYAQSSVVTSKRLMARPALPRFLRSGDSFEAGVVVTSKGFGPAPVSVRASAFGLQAQGQSARSVSIGRDQSLEVRFPFRAEGAGKATLSFEVLAEKERDAVEVVRKIDAPAVLEAVALYGATDGAAAEKLGDLSQIRRDVGGLELSVASTALVGLEASADQLIEYPYGCTEQLSSRLMPLLPLGGLARDFGFDLPPSTPALVKKTVGDLIGRQRGDGGFGMWPDSQESSPWASAYAIWTLDQARRRGEAVPPPVIERGKNYLRSYLADSHKEPIGLTTEAFFVDVLAELGAPDAGYMNRLFQSRKQLPLFGRALVLHALAVAKQKGELIDTLQHELENGLRFEADAAYVAENLGDEYAVLMDSPARSGALVLRALIAAQPGHPLAAKLARGLLRQRRGGSWQSTQETAFALLALDGYRRAQERELPDFAARVWMGEAELLSASMSGRSTRSKGESIPAARLPASSLLTFQKQGKGTLFYEARLKYARRSLPATPLDRGLFVQKTLRRVAPAEIERALGTLPDRSEARFTAGDLVLADLVVVTPSPREYVVIDDPLPAGFEAVDARLATTAAWLRVPGSDDECLDCDSDDALAHGRAFLSSWFRREIRDDRVLFFVDHMAAGMYRYRYLARATTIGSFVQPPAKAEAMYTPEVFGRTAAGRIDVIGGAP